MGRTDEDIARSIYDAQREASIDHGMGVMPEWREVPGKTRSFLTAAAGRVREDLESETLQGVLLGLEAQGI